ncbi:hypothetical protein FRC20_001636 [Serendipita sp. 405]|nr:hypothetical protein FRC20_001636 [Serendipita sp. 405]
MPLYLQSALAILRDMGSNFTYGGFLHQLRQRIFNMSQSSMLQMRLGLLDSFLHGGGQDISSYFGPGKLLIIDLSDRFVDGKTASMLFDICLGLFMEWKAPTGKLIVLDEAHKYLTPFTSNQLTSTISGIIRQQRHLSTRVIISTQEPTVVPAPVLDLLSWIICHRFSSPSWVKHLDRHVCVDERNARNKWEDHVMTLKTGEAVLFSPGSLFLSKGGATSTLSTGYAIIKSRPRVTKDGGMSIMATDEKDTGVGASKGVPLRAESPSPFAKQTEPESTILALQASSTTSPLAVADFSILKAVLNELRLKTSYEFHPYLVVHQAVVAKRPGMFFKEMRWKTYIQCAESHQIVQVIENGEDKYLTLALPYRSVLTPVSGASNTESFKLSLQTPKGNTNSPEVHKEFEILISLMNRLSSADVPHVGQSTIGAELAKSSSTGVRGLGYKNVKNFLTAAQEAGIVQLDSKVVNQEHFWRLSISFMHVFTHS